MNEADIKNLLVGRSILLRSIKSAKNWQRYIGLSCSLENQQDDHIGLWKQAIKTSGADLCEDEKFEVLECSRCSAVYAGFKARKIMKGKLGIISGILTRTGNRLREKEPPEPSTLIDVADVIDYDDIPF